LDVGRMMTLLEVADHGSITAAAEAMGYTTSAVSQQIGKLEKEAGQPLLERHPRGIVLTEAGHAVLRHAGEILLQLQAADAELEEIRGLRRGILSIGTFPTAGSSLLPLVVKEFKVEHPGIELKVFSGRFNTLVQALHRRDVEVALLWDYEWNKVDDPSLTYHHLMDDPTVILVASNHPLAGRKSVRIKELSSEAWITRADNHPVAHTLERLCKENGYMPRTSFRAHDYGEVQAMVGVGLGIALAPRLSVLNLREDVRAVDLADHSPERRILVAHLTERKLSAPAQEAIAQCQKAAHQLARLHARELPGRVDRHETAAS